MMDLFCYFTTNSKNLKIANTTVTDWIWDKVLQSEGDEGWRKYSLFTERLAY